jgi:DNA-binding CsgD family transcriptional regulator
MWSGCWGKSEVAQTLGYDLLTAKERECLQMVAHHLRTKDIARQMGSATATIDRHISSACRKLKVNDRSAAVRLLISEGRLGDPSENLAVRSSDLSEAARTGLAEGAKGTPPYDQLDDRNRDLHLGPTGARTESPGARRDPERDGAIPGVIAAKAAALHEPRAVAAGDSFDSGLHLGQPLSGGPGAGLQRHGPLTRLAFIVLIGLASALLLAGALAAVNAVMAGLPSVNPKL